MLPSWSRSSRGSSSTLLRRGRRRSGRWPLRGECVRVRLVEMSVARVGAHHRHQIKRPLVDQLPHHRHSVVHLQQIPGRVEHDFGRLGFRWHECRRRSTRPACRCRCLPPILKLVIVSTHIWRLPYDWPRLIEPASDRETLWPICCSNAWRRDNRDSDPNGLRLSAWPCALAADRGRHPSTERMDSDLSAAVLGGWSIRSAADRPARAGSANRQLADESSCRVATQHQRNARDQQPQSSPFPAGLGIELLKMPHFNSSVAVSKPTDGDGNANGRLARLSFRRANEPGPIELCRRRGFAPIRFAASPLRILRALGGVELQAAADKLRR